MHDALKKQGLDQAAESFNFNIIIIEPFNPEFAVAIYCLS
jgi:hypothetical protein